MPRIKLRAFALPLAAAVLSLALVACDDAGGDSTATPTATPTETATSTDTPVNEGGGTSGSAGGNAGSPAVSPTAPGSVSATPGPDTPVSSDDPSSPTPAPTEDPGLADGTRVVALAPIESIDVLFLESFPVQYRLHVVSGLPSGCAAFHGVEVEREGTTFTVTVTNTVPAPNQQIACTMIYGLKETSVDLGTGLESGTEYTVNVNDQTTTFVAQ